jgi:carbon storage regulator
MEERPMLVLSRKVRERLIIDETIVLTVVQVKHGRVYLGVEAPPEVRILREEVLRRDQRKPRALIPGDDRR